MLYRIYGIRYILHVQVQLKPINFKSQYKLGNNHKRLAEKIRQVITMTTRKTVVKTN